MACMFWTAAIRLVTRRVHRPRIAGPFGPISSLPTYRVRPRTVKLWPGAGGGNEVLAEKTSVGRR